jgi:hypothetical protein
VKSWHVQSLDLKPRLPEILSSTPDARVIALDLRTGESLPDHEVHERAWVVVVDGEVESTSASGERVSGGAVCWSRSRPQSAMRLSPARTPGCCFCSLPGRALAIRAR